MAYKILVAGANGYIGSQLVSLLLAAGHQVYALVRHPADSEEPAVANLTTIAGDLLTPESLTTIPQDIDVAYYLVHAMSYGRKDFPDLEDRAAHNFVAALRKTSAKQIIYLSGLVNEKKLSPHLASRYKTECILKESGIPYTVLRAGIVIGSGSASFEIIRDLVEKLPVMVAPKWVKNLCQPIAISDVMRYLTSIIMHPECMNQVFDIGGPERLNYKEMLLGYAKARELKRYIFVVPVLTPRLSSYWLYFVTSVNFSLASALVDSLKNHAICHDDRIQSIFPQPCLGYMESLKKALDVIEQNALLPSWKDSLISDNLESRLSALAKVPTQGCLVDQRLIESPLSAQEVTERVWAIGGQTGWYYMNWAWKVRGFIDKVVGGVGLQRGRSHSQNLRPGFSLDFWRVLVADKATGHLLLYAEMKVPGEAWLEFYVTPTATGCMLQQTASFRPKGLSGRLYWYTLLPFHLLIFRGMARQIAL
ncbi:MAG: SDR family oxidoreductase [Chlamydiales bacterium]|nr:SDR family oxidoreductase [Chlamydiales bacterium]